MAAVLAAVGWSNKTVLALWVFWALNLMLMELAAGELDKWRDENAEV